MTEANDVAPAPPPGQIARHGPFLAILGSAMLLRFLLAYVAFPSQGFASDLNQFCSWASALASGGPGSFYESSGANYPPGYMYVLWLLGVLGQPRGAGQPREAAARAAAADGGWRGRSRRLGT